MGLFADWQPQYAALGVSTFPLMIDGKAKRPATKGYARCGLKGSRQLAFKFPEMNAFGFMAGERNGITLLDLDSPDDEDLLREVLRRFGDTPLISRTGSGGFHCYYRHGGELREVRPDPNMPVDRLGGGVVVAPPSKGSKGDYAWIRGSVADLHRLPFLRADTGRREVQQAVTRELVQEGNRNRALFEHLMREARHVDTFEALLDMARTFADDRFAAPIPDSEVVRTAKSAWGYETTGRNRFGQGRQVSVSRDVVMLHAARNPDAFALFSVLQAQHQGIRGEFALARTMTASLGWHLRKFNAARDYLVNEGLLRCVHSGGRGPKDPARYRLC